LKEFFAVFCANNVKSLSTLSKLFTKS
jgi:hypothetical protein